MITREALHDLELQTPQYEFVEPEPDAEELPPLRRSIAKLQETATTFTLYEVYRSIGQLDDMIAKKQEEIDAHKKHKELFEAELALVEKALGVTDMETSYQTQRAAEIVVEEAMKNQNNETAPEGS